MFSPPPIRLSPKALATVEHDRHRDQRRFALCRREGRVVRAASIEQAEERSALLDDTPPSRAAEPQKHSL
jgi:hypothetical protein